MPEETKKNYLDIVQIYRGIAALMVVLHHAVGSLHYYHNIDYKLLNLIGKIGKLGVDFFFILSGFIISYAVYYKYNNPNYFKNYLLNRIIRVYVPYLPIGIAMYLSYVFLPGFSNSNREISLVTSLTLFPNGNPALSVAWTLTFELCFYILFSIYIYSKKVWNAFVVFWIVLIILFNYSSLFSFSFLNYPIFKVLFSTYCIEFIVGYSLSLIILHDIKINLQKQLLVLLLVILLCFFSTHFFNKTFYFLENFLWTIFIFFSLCMTITQNGQKQFNNSIMMYIGNTSYSIYLIHNPLQMLIIRFYPKITSLLNVILSLSLVLFLSILMGSFYYHIFEKKCIGFVKNKLIKT